MRPLLLSSVLALLALACAPPEASAPAGPSSRGEAPNGVAIYNPNAAWNGYTLAFHRRQYPILIDMRGEVVRSWPEVRMKSRVRLTADCTLLGISTGRAVVEHDWKGEKIWSASFENRFPHHDVIRLAKGNTMFLSRPNDSPEDEVFEVDRAGRIVWRWGSLEPLAVHIEARGRRSPGDPVHLNSVQELPENPWFRSGDERFRPGNLLLSARNLNLVLIVDRSTGEVVWTYRGDLSLQHEALMVGPESDRNGFILIFDNRYKSFWTDRRSEVIEIDPRDGSTVWRFSTAGFFSSTSGSQQPLPNGNVVIVSSNNSRAFEVDRDGRTVWEWTPPYRLDRPQRYGRDHCPELEALPPPDGPPIRPPAGYRFVDRDSYRFARSDHLTTVRLGGVRRQVLRSDYRCANLLVPAGASAKLGYGVDRHRVAQLGLTNYRATFSLALRKPDSDGRAVVFQDTLAGDDAGWRERALGLDALAHQRVEMCLEATEDGLDSRVEPRVLAFWAAPGIAAGADADDGDAPEGRTDLTPEELEVRLEHLRAMGYVN